MSKSIGNYIGVTEDPRDMYGKVMSIPDDAIDDVLPAAHRTCTPTSWRPSTALSAIGSANPRDLKARLAREIITRLRGGDAAAEAEEHFDRVFRRRLAADDVQTLGLLAGDDEDGASTCPRSSSAGSGSRAPRAGAASAGWRDARRRVAGTR